MSRFNLNAAYDFNLTLLGIVSSLRDYRLCWYINRELGFNFVKAPDLEITTLEKESRFFSVYIHINEITETEHRIIKNKGMEGVLIPERKETDFFWLINKRLPEQDEAWIVRELNHIEIIQKAFTIEFPKLKSKEFLIF